MKKMFKVYLFGPISGLSYDDAIDWRTVAKEMLADLSGGRIEGYSPMRSKSYLSAEKTIIDTYEDTLLSSSRGIITRDRFDCMTCDAGLGNFIGAAKVSIGSVIELGWLDAWRKPIVLAMEKEFGQVNQLTDEFQSNVHEHSMIREITGFRTEDLDQAIETVVKVLLP